ncbi:MAG: zinc metalloprotease HtpX [Chloroflexota bacterium]|nr:zinc metalloprotease HtpX [Chloroflexota bacterium]
MMLIGYLVGGSTGVVIAFVLALATNFFSYWNSDRIALAMAGAREVSPAEAPELHRLVEQLAFNARIPKPRVYIIDNPSPNAFATGRDPQHAAVAATTGIMRLLSYDELAGVMAHELAHIKSRDTLIQTVVATIAGTIMFVAQMAQFAALFGGFGRSDDDEGSGNIIGLLVAVFVAPIAATLIQLAISRAREYSADELGARISGEPLALASALQKLEAGTVARPMQVSPAAAHLYIVRPFRGAGLASLFSTHPPIPERVARLQRMATGARFATL